jgi:MarR family transcriptional regulator, organic hydroperoxide resistance regulator
VCNGYRVQKSADSDGYLRLDQQLCFPLYAAANAICRAYSSLLEPLGLTYPQYLVMLVLWESAPLSVGQVGERLLLDSGTLTPLLKRLESAGLVKRQRDRDDERRVLVDLTLAGRRLKAKARAVPEALACRLLIAPLDAMRLRQDLRALLAVLNDAGEGGPTVTRKKVNSR